METELLGFVATGGCGGRQYQYQKTQEGPLKTIRGNSQEHCCILNTTIADAGDLAGIGLQRAARLTFSLQTASIIANVGMRKRG